MIKPKEYDEIKKILKKQIVLDKYDLILTLDAKQYGNFPSKGGESLKNIWWYKYHFNNNYKGYDFINLMFFKIPEEKRLDAINNNAVFTSSYKTINNKKYSMSNYYKSHVDGGTGNIHPGTDFVKSQGFSKISQLVLCKKRNNKEGGPNTPSIKFDNINEVYFYSDNTKVHKSCYFPRIDNSKPQNDWRYDLLKEIVKQIPKEVLSNQIIDSIYNSKKQS